MIRKPEQAVIKERTADYVVAVHQAVLIQLWITGTSLDGVKAVQRIAKSMGEALKLTIVIVEPGADLPDTAARAQLDQLGRELVPRVSVAAMVQEGTGFRSAALRAIMAGIAMFTRQTLPFKFFASVEAACAWIKQTYPDMSGGQDLDAAIAALRASLRR